METWRSVWRRGIAPQLSDRGLAELEEALTPPWSRRLVQNAITLPALGQRPQDRPVQAACAIGYCGWMGDGLESVALVEEYFYRVSYRCDRLTGEAAGCRHFVSWFDDTDAAVAFPALLEEVRLERARRQAPEAAHAACDEMPA